jgi:hypothetical protein
MKNFPMPTGKPTYFKGDIRKINPEAFGFCYCKIIYVNFTIIFVVKPLFCLG